MKNSTAGLRVFSRPVKRFACGLLAWSGLLIATNCLQAQSTTQDSIVQITAEAQGLTIVPPDQLPRFGTYWLVMPAGKLGCISVPMPVPFPTLTTYQVADGQFIVDGIAGEVANAQIVETQATTIVSLINQIQAQALAAQFGGRTELGFGRNGPMGSGGGDSDGDGDFTNGFAGYAVDTNSLYLLLTNVQNGLAYCGLGCATDQVYAILESSSLSTPMNLWTAVAEVWPTDTNCMPFTVPTQNQNTMFLNAVDWTGVELNGLPCWWTFYWFGNLNESASDTDWLGLTLSFDYAHGRDPNVIQFSVQFTNSFVSTLTVPVELEINSGVPFYMAVLVNTTNADAAWHLYNPSNVLATLGPADGAYTVYIGLRGFATNATESWQSATVTLYATAPLLTLTNPIDNMVYQSPVQLQGYANHPLTSLTFDVSNAAGVITNQTAFLTGQVYVTNTLFYATNYFECSGVALNTGTNLITLHATDWVGNTTNISLTLTYSPDTNAPVLSVVWPPNGTPISGSAFTLQAQVSDPTATVTAFLNGSQTPGLVEAGGMVWVQNLPLTAGTNTVTLTASNVFGGLTIINFTVVGSDVGLVIDPLPANQLNQAWVSVTGWVGDPVDDCVFVNNVQAYYVDNDGDWEADGVPVSLSGTAVLNVQVYTGDPVLVSSQTLDQAQPVTVGMMSYSGWHEMGFRGQGTDAINWAYNTGGNYDSWFYGNEGITANENGVAYIDLNGLMLAFEMPWEYGSVTTPEYYGPWDYSYANHTQTRVMVEPSGQTLAGTTNIYLVLASAMEFSAFEMEYTVNCCYGWDYEHLLLDIGSVPDYQGYSGDTPLPPEWLQIRGQALLNAGITNADGSVSGMALISAPAGVNWDVTPVATKVYQNWAYTFNVQAFDATPRMLVDDNHDGNVDRLTTPNSPYRIWLNDSQEHGDDESSVGADDQIPGSSSPNYNWNHPQGRSDYVNFFPVALCLSNVMQMLPFTNGYEYHLSQSDAAVKLLYTDLTLTNAFDYLTNSTAPTNYATIAGYDPSFSPNSSGAISFTTLDAADLILVTSAGLVLNTNWLAQVQTNGGTGVILMEGYAATKQPLMLQIYHSDQLGNKQLLGSVPLYLSISGVEQMFRHLNLSAYSNGTVDSKNPSRASAPNEPPTNGKNLVFLHGYNVNQQQARGVESEMFKRFYWSGSRAEFYGVTWNGAVSQGNYIANVTCNYQTNVVNALLTAPHLADFLNGLPGDTVVVAHSLGNLVALSAISDFHATAMKHYFMIDAAVPIEAVQGDVATEPAMIYSTWQDYSNWTFASSWWQLFPTGDARSTLTWSNRVGNLGNVDIYNLYSMGEEVLREDTDDPPPGVLSGGVTQLVNIWSGVAKGAYTWVWEEKGKGNASQDDFISSTHGGWRFPENQYGDPDPVAPTTANSLPASVLQQTPVFDFGSSFEQINGSFADLALTNPDGSGSAYALANHDRILSDAIPALTLPVGANSVSLLDQRAGATRNLNMQTKFESGWPAARSTGGEAFNWHHSDFDYVAYQFTRKLFNEIVNDGNLK